MTQLSLSIICDQPIVQIGLTSFIKGAFDGAIIFSHNSVQMKSVNTTNRNLVLISIARDEKIELLRQLKIIYKKGPNNVIIYDQDITSSHVAEFIALGVKGYVSAEDPIAELAQCINDVQVGQRYLSTSIHQAVLGHFISEAASKRNLNKILSPREREVTKYLLRGIKTCAIAEKIDRKPSTISTIKLRIFKKLNVSNVIELRHIIQSSYQEK